MVVAGVSLAAPAGFCRDCDGNGVDDSLDLAPVFALGEPQFLAVGSRPTSVAAADLDGNGALDLVVSNTRSQTVSVLLRRDEGGAPLFRDHDPHCVGAEPRGIAAADLDGDTVADVVCGTERGIIDGKPPPRVAMLRGRGDGMFSPGCKEPCEILEASCAEGEFPALEEFADAIRTVALADVDGDGDLDVVNGISCPDGGIVSVLFNRGGGELSAPAVLNGALAESRYIAVGDVNGDTHADVVTAGGEILLGRIDEDDATRPVTVFDNVPDEQKGVALADVNADGSTDIVVARTATAIGGPGAGELRVFLGDGRGEFTRLEQPRLGDLCDLLESVTPADLDGDRDIDLVVTHLGASADEACALPGVSVLLNDGGGRFESGAFRAFPGTAPRWAIVEDLNRDGRPDIVVTLDRNDSAVDEVAVLLNRTARSARDRNGNGLLDDCEFHRGDTDGNLAINLSDAVRILLHLFRGDAGVEITCLEAADVDNGGSILLTDAVRLLGFLFRGEAPPEPPTLTVPGACRWGGEWDDPNGLLGCVSACAAR